MNFTIIKTIICLVVMIAFLIMACITKNVNASHIFASFVIIIGVLTAKYLAPKKQNNE